MRTRAQIILLSSEQGLKAPEIAQVVRESERTVQRWLSYQAEGTQGLYDVPKSGNPGKVTPAYKDQLISSVRHWPRAIGLPFSLWTLERLADYMTEQTGIRISQEAVRQHLNARGIVLFRPQYKIARRTVLLRYFGGIFVEKRPTPGHSLRVVCFSEGISLVIIILRRIKYYSSLGLIRYNIFECT